MMTGMIQQVMDTLKRPDGAKQMQQIGPSTAPGAELMQQGMGAEGIGKEEQEEMMRQMGEAMQQLQKMEQPHK